MQSTALQPEELGVVHDACIQIPVADSNQRTLELGVLVGWGLTNNTMES
jgi:hypothetical protein